MKKLYLFLIVLAATATYASTYQAASLNNVIVGGKWSQIVSIRFQATSVSPLAAARLYWIISNPPDHGGYMLGNGGHYSYTLRQDVNGQPGATLAVASVVQDRITGNKRGNFPLICFPPVSLWPGQFYDIVVQNIDPNPSLNWSSLDFLYNAALTDQTPELQVWASNQGGQFAPSGKGTLIGSPIAIFYADGTAQGHGDIAISTTSPTKLQCGSAYGFPASLCQQ